MSLQTKKVSLHEIDGKIFEVKLYEPAIEQAVLTHYLHNMENGISNWYKKDALKIVKAQLDNKKNNNRKRLSVKEALQQYMFEVKNVPFPAPLEYTFTFIDLFAGVGGFRLGLQKLGGKCVFTSEWNKEAQKTYKTNFGEMPFGDITKEGIKRYIPEKFDILCAGFPCQAFSIAGYRKGFTDTRGTLFFDIEKIAEKHRPKVIFLENVKNLQSHDSGKTFKIMLDVLENKLGYQVYFQVLNSMTHANVPQNRERIFIVAFDPKQIKNHKEFEFPKEVPLTKKIHSVIHTEKQDDIYYYKPSHKYYSELRKIVVSKDTLYQWRRVYVRENKSNVCPTLTANMGTGGHNVPIVLDNFGIRKLTPRECFSFQGYPKNYVLPNSANSSLYMQAGNSVTVPLIQKVGSEILKVINS